MRDKFFARFGICMLHLVYKGLCENILRAMAIKLGSQWVNGAYLDTRILADAQGGLNNAVASYKWPALPNIRRISMILKTSQETGYKLAYGPAVLTISFLSISPFVMMRYTFIVSNMFIYLSVVLLLQLRSFFSGATF